MNETKAWRYGGGSRRWLGGLLFCVLGCQKVMAYVGMVLKARLKLPDSPLPETNTPDAAAKAEGLEAFGSISSSPESFQNETCFFSETSFTPPKEFTFLCF